LAIAPPVLSAWSIARIIVLVEGELLLLERHRPLELVQWQPSTPPALEKGEDVDGRDEPGP
jgi:hypothetical protein